jgi:hypothetical protein
MRITSTGYIGIGTTSPSYPLVVSDAGAKGIEFIPNAEANTSQILSYNRSGAVWTNLRYVAEKHEFYFRNTEIFTANSTILSLSGLQGIKFQASQSASSDANTLDDYEEGTWTPTYLGSTSNPTVSYSEQLGSYIKIGRLVVCFVKIVKSSASGGSGSLMLGGLPFTASSPGYGMASRIMSWSWHPASPDYKADQLYVNQGSTTAMVWDVATNTITVATMVAGIGTIITGMFSYYTSA